MGAFLDYEDEDVDDVGMGLFCGGRLELSLCKAKIHRVVAVQIRSMCGAGSHFGTRSPDDLEASIATQYIKASSHCPLRQAQIPFTRMNGSSPAKFN